MNNVKILDCTLRDGGRIIDCKFPNQTIKSMTRDLTDAGIDIVEVGFLRDENLVHYEGNSTFFTEVSQIAPFIPKNKKNTIYTVFVDYNMYDCSKLSYCDGTIQGVRVGFTKKQFDTERDEIIKTMQIVKEKGYQLFIQGVNSLAYTDRELLDLVDMVNEIEPYGFGIVDTYGAMYLEDLIHFYTIVDYNLKQGIWIDIHSHNNFQSSFAFAQQMIQLANGKRNIILDSTLNGMGKCAGNLNTELIIDYLVRRKNKNYDFDKILDAIDRYLMPLKEKYDWGYSIPAFMAGIYQSHPNNIIYLTEKYRLNNKDMKYIISSIDKDTRQRYDYDNIHRIYKDYMENQVDDTVVIDGLKQVLENKKILVLVPGKTIDEYSDKIMEYIEKENPYVISVNFIPSGYQCHYHFYANTIHWEKICFDIEHKKCIITSNIHEKIEETKVVDYISLTAQGSPLYDNSTILLLNLLNKLGVMEICVAGFDGLKENENNYVDETFPNQKRQLSIEETNKTIKKMFIEYKDKVKDRIKVTLLTPSEYE